MKEKVQIIRLNMCYRERSKRINNTPYSILISFNAKMEIYTTMPIEYYALFYQEKPYNIYLLKLSLHK
ncbi:hypothetical protein, partial [Bacteroides xylanisolvens]|uniref:hypothetical protein n=1 Tax=Bacteroides xylanisolvens TaxID=371601 RepID=UPI001960E159